MTDEIWRFKTKRFTILMTAKEEHDLDLSWDETGEVLEKLESGEYQVFMAKCSVLLDGNEIGADYLGQCIYSNPLEFRDHIGMNLKGHGSYFSDMVRQAIVEARGFIKGMNSKPVMRETI